MENESTGGASAPKKTKLEMAKDAQAELQESITANRIELLKTCKEHDGIGGKDNTAESLFTTVRQFPDGIEYAFLQTAFPDAALAAARKHLIAGGRIQQIGKKGNVILKLAELK